MKHDHTIKVNFRGGIISPGELYDILVAVEKAGITKVKFGLRQQLLIDAMHESLGILEEELRLAAVPYEMDEDIYPNMTSSYPAEEVFIHHTWLSEGVYKDIFDAFDYRPKLKINISDSNQSFTPLLTGNINWVAAPASPHFWYLFIRFPKTNTIYECRELVYTNDLARMSKAAEELILQNPQAFYDNPKADGDRLFEILKKGNYILQPAEHPAKLPSFNLPYYEGLNRYNDKYWLGIYRRDELFSISFLKDICRLCLATKIGLLCSTPWKSVIVKNIGEKERVKWNALLAKHQINVRHAANELNFQVEDNCSEGLALKDYLLKRFHQDDTRTFGVCIGIKTRKKSEVFSSILVRRKALINIFGIGLFYVYDILCAHDFNPNERTGFVFSSNNPKFLLAEQLRRAIFSFHTHRYNVYEPLLDKAAPKKEPAEKKAKPEFVYQCKNCLTVYDDKLGEPANAVQAGVLFDELPENFTCSLCESAKEDFVKVDKLLLWSPAI
ncbi:MAG: hypothetical protein RLZZ28_1953 [Bacteroidota bacterium]